MAWYNESWTYRVKITIQSSQINSDLTEFPVYLRGSDFGASTFTNAKSAAEDFRITKADGTTELPFEIVYYDSGSNEFLVHFKADFVSSSSDTVFYLYYGNSGASAYGAADTYGRNNVWADYYGVWHLREDFSSTSTAIDSTGNGRNFTVFNSPTNSAGKLSGNTLSLNGSNEYLAYADSSNAFSQEPMSISFWFKPHSVSGGLQEVFSKGLAGNNRAAYSWQFAYNRPTVDDIRFGTSDGSGTAFVGTSLNIVNVWAHVQGIIFSNGHISLYHNGSLIQTNTSLSSLNNSPSNTSLNLGRVSGASGYYDGEIDSVRVRNADVSADWIAAEYANQNSPATFYAVGGEETDGGGGPTFKPRVNWFM
jgi:hypothetical protein